MKIALVVHTAFPDFIGGREHNIHHLAARLSKSFEIVVISGAESFVGERFIDEYRLVTLPMWSITLSRSPLQKYRFIFGLYSTLVKECPDIVHAFEYGLASTDIACLYAQKKKKPFYLTAYGYKIENSFLRFAKRIYDITIGKKVLSCAYKIFGPSQVQIDEFQRIGKQLIHDKCKVQINSINVEMFSSLQENKGEGSDGAIRILTIARLLPRKRIEKIIEVLSQLKKREDLPNYTLYIIGPDCGSLNSIENTIKHLDMHDTVHLLGALPYDQMKGYYADCDIFVLLSDYEGVPLVLCEAMACGKAVLASSLPGTRSIIKHNVNGLLVEPEDTDSLAKQLLLLIKDSALRHRIGHAAIEAVKQYDSSFEAQKLKEEYERAVKH